MITTIMANFNDGPMIEQAVLGVIHQTTPPEKIIIIDDGSTDDSAEIINNLFQRYPDQIIVLKNEVNKGVVYSFNRALAQVTTKYVNFVSMDDAIHPTWMEKSLSILQNHPNSGLCFTDLNYTNGKRSWRSRCLGIVSPRYFAPEEFVALVPGHHISGTSVTIRVDRLLEVGGYRPELKWHSDWFAWLAVAGRYGVCYVPEALVTLTVRDTSHSVVGSNDLADQQNLLFAILQLICSSEFVDVYKFFVLGQYLRHWNYRLLVESFLKHSSNIDQSKYNKMRELIDFAFHEYHHRTELIYRRKFRLTSRAGLSYWSRKIKLILRIPTSE